MRQKMASKIWNLCKPGKTLSVFSWIFPLPVLSYDTTEGNAEGTDNRTGHLTRTHQLWALPTFTTGTTLIKGESTLAFTGEASRSILANALRPTQVDIRGAFIVIYKTQWGSRGGYISSKLSLCCLKGKERG